MKCFFSNPDFDYQLVKLLDSARNLGADLSECLSTSILIEEGNTNSWYEKWMDLANLVRLDGEKKLAQNHNESASASFLRASNYYRQAYTFLFYETDSRISEAYQLQKECFSKAAIPSIQLTIPFENGSFTANFYPAATTTPAPTLIVNQGYDGNQQDSFFEFHQSCQAHGYHLLTFDGPGQGEQLINPQFAMPTEWQKILSPLIDQILQMPLVDPLKICLIGQGWGTLFAAIGAANDSRVSSLILSPGVIDPMIGIERFFPDIRKKIEENDSTSVNTLFAQAMSNKMVANKFKLHMMAHQVDSPFELMKVYMKLNLSNTTPSIRCPTLLFECPDEPTLKDQADKMYETLGSDKKMIHSCHAPEEVSPPWGSLMTSSHQSIIFDWLDEQLKAQNE